MTFTPFMERTTLSYLPFTTEQAKERGLSRVDLVRMVEAGLLRRLFRGVYVDAREPDSRELRVAAAKLIKPDNAVASDETAAWILGVDAFRPSEQYLLEPSFVVPHATSRLERDDVDCRQANINSDDITYLDGIHLTTPLRTASDLLRGLYRPYAFAAGDALLRAGLVDHEELIDAVHRLKGYPGVVQARSLVVMLDARAESPGESWQRLRILDAGFPAPELQYEFVDALGRTWFLDHAYPKLRIGSEYDGTEFHTFEVHRRHDGRRRGDLSDVHGWRWANGTRTRIFGTDTSFEDELGGFLGIRPRGRTWGNR